MEACSWFSASYHLASQRFKEMCSSLKEAGHRIETRSLPIGGEGPNGEELAIDVAIIGDLSSGKILLSSSGVHGVEGYAGSAIQLSIMDKMRDTPFDDHAVVFIHVVNPFGMAWWRRFNENNVDLNRNFLKPGESYSGVPEGYHHVRSVVNPESPPRRFDPLFLLRSILMIMRHGFNSCKQWIAEGQYEDSKAIQFGGFDEQTSTTAVMGLLNEILIGIDKVWAVDLHTGLGPSGHDTLLVDASTPVEKSDRMKEMFPGHVEALSADAGVGYQIKGDLHQGLMGHFPEIDWMCMTQEFGTISPLKVLKASRNENRWTQWGGEENPLKRKEHWSRMKMLRAFNVDSPKWRADLIERGNIVFESVREELLR